ncbi:MAG: hypothetical protein JXB08_01305 [Bacilli bacterium]|nr:hypothetical protein [Bacilli bacterium]MBN2876679.1 hypothetical protein [Bacilli bacterium]
MMFKKLLSVFFKENFGFSRILGFNAKKQKGKAIAIGVLLVYGLGAFLFTFGYLFFDLGKILNQVGVLDILLIYGFIYATVLSVMFVLFRANGYLFNYKDYQILQPLPIPSRTVISAKIVVMMVFIYLSVFIFIAPIAFSYFYHGGFNVLGLLFFLIGTLTIPIIPLVVFSFVSLLIARLTAKMRHTNIINIVLLFVVFLGIMYGSFSLNFGDNLNPLLNQQDFMDALGSIYPPITWFVGAVNSHNVLDLLFLLASNAAVLVIFVYAIQKLVTSTNQRAMSKVTRKNNKAAVAKQRSIIGSIAAKETKTFFNTTIYALNIGFGPVIMIILGVASIFYADNIQNYFATEMGLNFGMEIIILILLGFSLSMVYSTAVSLSLEGKQFWILRSLPIKPKTVMYGKMLFNIYLGLPAAVITTLMFSYAIKLSFLTTMMILLFVVSLSLMVTVFGAIINLYVPKFEFRNPTEVVKQSAGAMFALFGSWIILVVDGLIFYFVTKTMSNDVGILLMSLLNLLLFAGMVVFIEKKTESLFNKFEV